MGKVIEQINLYKKKYPLSIIWRSKKHAKVVESYLNPGEKVLYVFGGQKNSDFLEIFNSYVIALTNKRILLGHKRMLWGSFYYTITPELYNDMTIYRGLIWGKIIIDTIKEKVILSNIDKHSLDEIETNISEFMLEAKKKYVANEKDK